MTDVNKIVQENIALVKSIAKKFPTTPVLDRDDYVSAGVIGLIKCLKTYTPKKGKITTYAYNPILWAMIRLYEKCHKNKPVTISLGEISTEEKTSKLYISDKVNIEEYFPEILTPKERKVIKLWLSNTKIKDIAKAAGMCESSVYPILRKAKIKIINATKEKNTSSK